MMPRLLLLLLLALLATPPAFAQTRSDEAANALFVEAVKARDEATSLNPGEDQIPALARRRDLLALVDRNLREIVDRHPGSGLAVRLVLGEEIDRRFSLRRAASEVAEARERLEVGQDVVGARRLLESLDSALSRARGIQDPRERLAELQRLRPQVASQAADIQRRHPRAGDASAIAVRLDREIAGLQRDIEVADAVRALQDADAAIAGAMALQDPSRKLAELIAARDRVVDIARRVPGLGAAEQRLRALDSEIGVQRAEVARLANAATNAAAGVGRVFRDCPECPEMVVVPAGATRLASGHDVSIGAPFAVGKFEVTFAEWDDCVAAGGCTHRPDDRRWGRGRQPVMNVSWDDAQQYVAWLSRKTGKSYRLLSEAEWEYAAQAGSGREQVAQSGANEANCDGCGSRWDGRQTAPVGSFAANAFGLHDMLGNVWEWTADCLNESHSGAVTDGSARMTGECLRRVLRGGSWSNRPRSARSADRIRNTSGNRVDSFGFRVARTL